MGYYNDVVIQIRKKDQEKFETYLDSDYTKNDRILDRGFKMKEIDEYLIYIWMNDHQLRVSAHYHYFDLGIEMEHKAGFEPEDYFAEMWIEDGDHVTSGEMDPVYLVQMDAYVYDEKEMRWV